MKTIAAVLAIATGSWTAIPGGTWALSPQQILEVRSRVESHVRSEAGSHNVQLPAWSQYSFQYQGRTEGQSRVVFVNAFCIPPPAYARSEFVVVFDDGPCFSNVKYDVEKRKFLPVSFNGHA
jgi:hypothetical protein